MPLCCGGPDLKVEPAKFSLDLLEKKFLGDDSNSICQYKDQNYCIGNGQGQGQ